jgi:hypothetical protein
MPAPYIPRLPDAPARRPKAVETPKRLRTAEGIHSEIDRLAERWNIPQAAKYILDSREKIEAIKNAIYRVEADRALDLAFAENTLRRYENSVARGGSAGNPIRHLLARELKRQETAREKLAQAREKARRENVDRLHRDLRELDLELKKHGLGGAMIPPA